MPCRPMQSRVRAAAGLALASVLLTSPRVAGSPTSDTADALVERAVRPARGNPDPAVTGIQRPGRGSSDAARAAANVALWLPREVVDLVFLTTGAAAGILENEQVVPRMRELLFTRDRSVGVYPTFFLETGASPNVGARMVAAADNAATTLRAGFGGPDENVAESRMRFGRTTPLPMMFSLEGLHERRTGLSYPGIGQSPETDARNRYSGGLRTLPFRDQRERVIGSLGLRPSPNLELFVSSSYTQRHPQDLPNGEGPGLDEVFVAGTVPGLGRRTRFVYTELAIRLDTRAARAAPVAGLLLETYAGSVNGVLEDGASFVRAGGRAAAFFPVYRRTNILSPKLVVDGIDEPQGAAVPVLELTRPSEFRGVGDRRDYVSVVGSLDYRWKLASFVAARLFTDVATVAPSLRELTLRDLRWVGGFGLDLFSSHAEIGRIGVAAGPDGVSFLLSFGVAPRFGDRQHRD